MENTSQFIHSLPLSDPLSPASTHKSSPKKSSHSQLNWKRWNSTEQLQYFIFLHHHIDKFGSNRKPHHIFQLMSKFIGTKTKSQCKNHHHRFQIRDIKSRVEEYKQKCPNFLGYYKVEVERLTKEEEEDGKIVSREQREKRQKEEKEDEMEVEDTENVTQKINKLEFYSKIKSLIYFYQQWEQKMKELLTLQP